MDRELLDYLNQQFGDVREQIQDLRQQFQDQRQETAQQFQELRQETAGQIDGLRQETAGKFEKTAEQIRLVHVLIEGVKGDIQLVAEGVAGVNEKLDSSRKESARELEEAQALSRLAERALNLRMDRTENRVLDVEARVVHLEATRG